MGKEHTLVSNFDSPEQRSLWNLIIAEAGLPNEYATPWHVVNGVSQLDQLLNTHPELISKFAGIIRTAYLYRNNIVLTSAQLLDGIFFLALGPETVNGLLGQSYKDGPAITVSGMGDNLEECLKDFYFKTLADSHQNGGCAKDSEQPFPVTDPQRTLAPKIYSALNREFKQEEIDRLDSSFHAELRKRISLHISGGEGTPEAIGWAINQIVSANEQPGIFDALVNAWKAWLEAEKQGLILYKKQIGPLTQDEFEVQAKKYYCLIKERINRKGGMARISEAERTCHKALMTIREQIVRTDALKTIAACNEQLQNLGERLDDNAAISPEILAEWYHIVYNNALAAHIDAELITTSAKPGKLIGVNVKQHRTCPVILLSGSTTELLAEMPYTVFSQLRYEHRDLIAAWQKCDSSTPERKRAELTKNVAYAVFRKGEQSELPDERSSLYKRVAITIAIALVATYIDLDPSMSNVPTAAIFLIVLALQIMPDMMELAEWKKLVNTTDNTVIYLS